MLTKDMGIFYMFYLLLVQININLICPFRLRIEYILLGFTNEVFISYLSVSTFRTIEITNQKVSINGGIVLEKAEKPEIKLTTSAGPSKKQESSRKTSISALLTMSKPLCGSQ